MKVVKLTPNDATKIEHLYYGRTNFMGTNIRNANMPSRNQSIDGLQEILLTNFQNTYMSDLKNYHAYGYFNDQDEIEAIIGYYASIDDASWYWTHVRTTGDNSTQIKAVLDKVMEVNEFQGRLKFYSMFPLKYRKTYRRLAFSKTAKERYDYFDEFYVKEKHQPIFNFPWQILYNRLLLPVDSIVRCTFLKQEYRDTLFHGGNL
jgi:hypothetical protein